MNEREALEKAWVERCRGWENSPSDFVAGWQAALDWARTQQEPVAWHFEFNNGNCATTRRPFDAENMKRHLEADETCTEWYTHPAPTPAQPIRLSDEQIREIAKEFEDELGRVLHRVGFAKKVMDAMLAKGAAQPAVVQQLVEALDALVHDDGYGCDRPTYLKAKAALAAYKE